MLSYVKAVIGVFHFEMPGLGLWTERSVLGKSCQVQHLDHRVEIHIPKSADDFGLGERPMWEQAFGGHSMDGPQGAAQEVDVLQVRVEGRASFDAGDFDADPKPTQEAFEVIGELLRIAESFVTGFVHHVRVGKGQYWLGTSADPPRRTWIDSLLDENEVRVPVGSALTSSVHVMGIETALDASFLATSASAAAIGEPADLPHELLNDARYLAWIREPSDLRLAVLLAAIACEVNTKMTLLGRSSEDQQPLVELILNNPRDVDVSTVTHLDKTVEAIMARSLRHENRELWKAANRLFQDRNTIAHGKGPFPPDESLREDLKTAGSVFEWLASL